MNSIISSLYIELIVSKKSGIRIAWPDQRSDNKTKLHAKKTLLFIVDLHLKSVYMAITTALYSRNLTNDCKSFKRYTGHKNVVVASHFEIQK